MALISLQPPRQRISDYGYFQGLPGRSRDFDSKPRVRLDTIGTLVNDYWGCLGTTVLSVYKRLLRQITVCQDYAIEEILLGDFQGYLGASVTDVSLVGWSTLAEWDCVVSCLKWLLAITEPAYQNMIIRSYEASGKSTLLRGSLLNSIPERFQDTTFQMGYKLEVDDFSKVYSTSAGLCWQSLFTGACIGAHASQNFTYSESFEETERWVGIGLKLEFSILIYMAGVDEIVDVDGTPVLCGFRSALVPVVRFEDGSVQWHLIVAKNDTGPFRWIQYRQDFLQLLPTERIRNTPINHLKGTAYVGWLRNGVTVILGTIDPPSEIPRSRLPVCQNVHIPSGFSVQVGIQSANLPINMVFNVTKVYVESRLAPSMGPEENFCAFVDQLYSRHVIVYDEGTRSALYCPLVNLGLFLVRAYLRNNGYPNDTLPLDSLKDLKQCRAEIRNLGGKVIVPGLTFHDILKVLVRRYTAVCHILPPEIRVTKSEILGFDLTDILGNNDVFYARKLAIGKGVRTWNTLAKNTDVVFCGGFGPIISVVSGSLTLPNCPPQPPSGLDVLVFPIPLLKTRFDHSDKNYLIQWGQDDFQWEPTASLFDCKSGNECKGKSCLKYRLQHIKEKNRFLKRRKLTDVMLHDFNWMKEDGIVCFGHCDAGKGMFLL